MILSSRSHRATAPRPAPPLPTPRQRLLWTLGNLLMLAGVYLLVFVGGIYTDISYQRMAARGDSDLVLTPRISSSGDRLVLRISAPSAPAPAARVAAPTPYSAPVLSADSSVAASTLPAHTSTVERMVIPSVAIDAKVIEVGWSLQDVDGQPVAIWDVAEYAVGQHRGSANPGEGGNIVFAGHVGGYGQVFRDLFYVHPGEPVVIYSQGQQFLYVVKDRLIIDEENASPEQRAANAALIAPTDHEIVTLVTCWPPTGPKKFTQRVVVRAVPYDTGVASAIDGLEPQAVR